MTSVPPGIKPVVLVVHAIMDPLLLMEPVLLMLILALYLSQTFYAKLGQKNHALHAQIEAFSMPMAFA